MKELWIALGIVSMGVGMLGIILPILPTTPFFIVSAYSFGKGSHRFHTWFHSLPFVQKHLSNLTMTKRKKWILLLTVDALLILYMVLFNTLILYIVLSTVIIIKHVVFYKYVTTI